MAEVLKELPQTYSGTRSPRSQWDVFADGQPWKLSIGVDVKSTTMEAARYSAHQCAGRRGMKAHFRKLSATEFAVQFVKKE